MRGWISNVQIVVICLGVAVSLAGCGGMNSQPVTTTPMAQLVQVHHAPSPIPIPTPNQMLDKLHTSRRASSVLEHNGGDFEAVLSQRVSANGTAAGFNSAWVDGYSKFDTVAYATYRFDLRGRVGRIKINTQWTDPPAAPALDYKKIWLGASNWKKDRWDWYSGAANGAALSAAGSLEDYRQPETAEMLVVVLLLAQASNELQRVWLDGFSMRGDWWMYGRDAAHTACSPFKGPDSPAILWQCQVGDDDISAMPVYDANGTIYYTSNMGGDLVVFGIHPDGTQAWMTSISGGRRGFSLTIGDDGTIYSTTDSGMYAMSPDGDVKWKCSDYQLMKGCPAIGPDGTLIVSCKNGAGDPESLLALKPDGTKSWEHIFSGGGGGTYPAINASGTAYLGSSGDSKLYAFTPDGAVQWSYPLVPGAVSGVAIGTGGMIYIMDSGPKLNAIHPDGQLSWTYSMAGRLAGGAGPSQPAVGADGTIYACDDTNIYAVNQNGTLRWLYRTGPSNGHPTVDAAGTVYVTSQDSRLYAIGSDGELKWSLATYSSSTGAPVIAEDGTLYIVSQSILYAIGPSASQAEHTASGYVKDIHGTGLAGVYVWINGEEPSETDASGYWSNSGLTDGQYLISPSLEGYSFAPQFDVLNISGADAGMPDFTGSLIATSAWPMQGANPAHTRRSPVSGPSGPTLEWNDTVGSSIAAEPVLGPDGAIFVQDSNNVLACVNPDGTVRWQRDNIHSGYLNSPAVNIDGTILIQTDALYALSPGNVYQWSVAGQGGAPVVAADGSITQVCGTASAFGVRRLDQYGTQQWIHQLDMVSPSVQVPAIDAAGIIYVWLYPDALLALNADGTEKWTVAAAPGVDQVPWQSTAAIGGDGTIYLGSGLNFYAYNPDGTQQWVYHNDTPITSAPALGADGTAYYAKGDIGTLDTNKLIALNLDGSLKWEYYADGYAFTSPPTIDSAGTIYIGIVGSLHAVNPDGTRKWTFDDPPGNVAGMAIGTDGTLYFGDSTGNVYAIGPGAG